MADEIRINSSLQYTDTNFKYAHAGSAFTADATSPRGPTPGLVLAALAGTDVSLANITTPGFCRISNVHDMAKTHADHNSTFVEVGIWDGLAFFPLMEILPGESYVFRMARNIGLEFTTGTASTGSGNSLRLNANLNPQWCLIEVFEK